MYVRHRHHRGTSSSTSVSLGGQEAQLPPRRSTTRTPCHESQVLRVLLPAVKVHYHISTRKSHPPFLFIDLSALSSTHHDRSARVLGPSRPFSSESSSYSCPWAPNPRSAPHGPKPRNQESHYSAPYILYEYSYPYSVSSVSHGAKSSTRALLGLSAVEIRNSGRRMRRLTRYYHRADLHTPPPFPPVTVVASIRKSLALD